MNVVVVVVVVHTHSLVLGTTYVGGSCVIDLKLRSLIASLSKNEEGVLIVNLG